MNRISVAEIRRLFPALEGTTYLNTVQHGGWLRSRQEGAPAARVLFRLPIAR